MLKATADLTGTRDIVFSPNEVESKKFGKVYQGFMKHRSCSPSETCKKTSNAGDLYLFYFGHPESKIAGFAICKQPPPQEGELIESRRMWFSQFVKLHHCTKPITADELRTNRYTSEWWRGRPYHGGPKTIPAEVAAAILRDIVRREPTVAKLLQGFVDEHLVATPAPDMPAITSAFEGTINERLTKQIDRSQALRGQKIRSAMNAQGQLKCEVPGCGFDFLATYGELGRGFAHVHHRQSLAKRSKGVRTPLEDLAIVCANCHAMIHRGGQCRPLKGLIS